MSPPIDFADLWVYLSAGPLLWLTLTVSAYVVADRLSALTNRHPFANPVVTAVALIAAVLLLSRTSYRTYFEGAQFVHFLLGPATVGLAVPLVRNLAAVRRLALPMVLALLAGSATAILSAVGIAAALGAPPSVLATLAPKSTTTPVAMAISRDLGGEPSLTAVLVIATGVLGAVTVTPLLDALHIRSREARGFAAGVAAHGIGTARAFQVSETAGLFAGLAMAMNAVATALIVPAVIRWFS